MIKRITIKDFKSIEDVTVDLNPLTVLVGRSGTGKSNFVNALRFLRDLLADPSQLQNGYLSGLDGKEPAGKENASLAYDITFDVPGIDSDFRYCVRFDHSTFYGGRGTQLLAMESLILGDNTLFHQQVVSDSNGRQDHEWVVEPDVVGLARPASLIIGQLPAIPEAVIAFTAMTTGLGCYEFPSDVLREGKGRDSSNGVAGLADDAANYLEVLQTIATNLQDMGVRRSIVASLRQINPTIASVELDSIQEPDHAVVAHDFDGRRLSLNLSQESDGFRRFYAHLLALHQQPAKQTLIFEEPENGIYPGAMSLLADEFKATPVAGRGQVILTTHNPGLLDYFDVDDLRAVTLEGQHTRIGKVAPEQREAVNEGLLGTGELLTVDPARLDDAAFRVGAVNRLVAAECDAWLRRLKAALKRPNLGGVLVVLDGDIKKVEGQDFCAARVADRLATAAKDVGGGSLFSVAVAFACQEFESWLIAGVESLAGKSLSDGRAGVRQGTEPPPGDLENAPRNAKGWLRKVMASGYKEAIGQVELAKLVDIDLIRSRPMRSFQRLELAVNELVTAVRDDKPVCTPIWPKEQTD